VRAGPVLLAVLVGAAPAAADPIERVDSIGAVMALTKDGRPSAGFKLGLNLVDRFGLAAQARVRDGELVENVDLVFQLTQGELESSITDDVTPIRLDLLAGVGGIERKRYATGSFGMAFRVRTTRWLTFEVILRDEVSRVPRPNRFVHVPEALLAISWTSLRFDSRPLTDTDD
jgi:hypothetical protein